jgi:hypothetical protein
MSGAIHPLPHTPSFRITTYNNDKIKQKHFSLNNNMEKLDDPEAQVRSTSR